jgi:hypothetical protein
MRNEDTAPHSMVIGVVCPEPDATLAASIAAGAVASRRRRRPDARPSQSARGSVGKRAAGRRNPGAP